MSSIVMSELTKKFGRQVVLDHVNLEVLDGEFFSILGLNASGKTTFMQLLLHFLKPSSGEIKIFDMEVKRDAAAIKEYVAVVTQECLFPGHLKPDAIFQKTLHLRHSNHRDELEELKEYFDFYERRRFQDLNQEEKKVFAMINALMVKPKLLILDEPTLGVSEEIEQKFFRRLKLLQRDEGMTVLLLTSSLPLAQRYSDRVAYLHDGRIQDLESMQEKTTRDKVVQIFDAPFGTAPLEEIGAKLIQSEDPKSYYYDGELAQLSQAIVDARLANYNVKDADLRDKIGAYYTKTSVPGGEQ